MNALTRYYRIYTHFWKLAFSLGAVYRVDTYLLFVSVILFIFQNFVFFGSMFRSVPQISGWNISEYVLLLSIYSLNWGIFKLFYGRTMEDVTDKVFTGQFDYYLLKPINTRFLSYFCPPLIKSFPSVIFNFFFVIFVLFSQHLHITLFSLLLTIVYMFFGQIIIFSFSQLAISTSFFTNNASDIYAIFENAWDQATYPGDVFNGAVRFALTFLVPIVLFATFPAKVMLGKTLSPIEYLTPPLVALICFFVSNTIYKFGVKNYTSAGG